METYKVRGSVKKLLTMLQTEVHRNSLNQNLKMSKTVKHFQNQFKNQLISQY